MKIEDKEFRGERLAFRRALALGAGFWRRRWCAIVIADRFPGRNQISYRVNKAVNDVGRTRNHSLQAKLGGINQMSIQGRRAGICIQLRCFFAKNFCSNRSSQTMFVVVFLIAHVFPLGL